MYILEKPKIILICEKEDKPVILKSLENYFNVFCMEKCNSILLLLRTTQISAIISYVYDKKSPVFEMHDKIDNTSSFVPKLAIVKDGHDLELIRKCGEVGIIKVMLYSDINYLPENINVLIKKYCTKVTLNELGIRLNEYMPELLRRALQFMEKEYIRLKSVEEIIDYLDTSYQTLSCHFKQVLSISPKVILMFFKIRHSLYLLKENTLSNKEIAYKSGFSNEKRFSECMKRIFDKTPGRCRSELVDKSIETFWQKTIKATI